jgi:hypothetical protein
VRTLILPLIYIESHIVKWVFQATESGTHLFQTVELKVRMCCTGCERVVKNAVYKLKGNFCFSYISIVQWSTIIIYKYIIIYDKILWSSLIYIIDLERLYLHSFSIMCEISMTSHMTNLCLKIQLTKKKSFQLRFFFYVQDLNLILYLKRFTFILTSLIFLTGNSNQFNYTK